MLFVNDESARSRLGFTVKILPRQERPCFFFLVIFFFFFFSSLPHIGIEFFYMLADFARAELDQWQYLSYLGVEQTKFLSSKQNVLYNTVKNIPFSILHPEKCGCVSGLVRKVHKTIVIIRIHEL